jgi:hypothetical protein
VAEHLELREADRAGTLLKELLTGARSSAVNKDDDNGDNNDNNDGSSYGLTEGQRHKIQDLVPRIADTIASSMAAPLLAELRASHLVTEAIQA